MRASLLAFTSAACLMTAFMPSAHASVNCDLTDHGKHALAYSFAYNSGDAFVTEQRVARDGVVVSNGGPHWDRSYDSATDVVTYTQNVWRLVFRARYLGQRDATGAALYFKDHAIPNATGVCSSDTPYVAPPPTIAPAAIRQATGFTVQTFDVPEVIALQYISVDFGLASYAMVVDTGCSGMTVSPAIANWLISRGQAVEAGNVTSVLANGSTQIERVISIAQITIGGHVITDVQADVIAPGQNAGDMLIGLGTLQRLGPMTIDPVNHRLTFS
jgi:predicted aspartyl protease